MREAEVLNAIESKAKRKIALSNTEAEILAYRNRIAIPLR